MPTATWTPSTWPSGWTCVGSGTTPITMTLSGAGTAGTTTTITANSTVYPPGGGRPIVSCVAPREISDEERASMRASIAARERESRERTRREGVERERAQMRARELLLAHLDAEQRAEFEERQAFSVTVRGRRYRITRSRIENVYRIEDEWPVERMCIHPREGVPLEDQMLAQKLMLETNEEEFLRIANRHRLAA